MRLPALRRLLGCGERQPPKAQLPRAFWPQTLRILDPEKVGGTKWKVIVFVGKLLDHWMKDDGFRDVQHVFKVEEVEFLCVSVGISWNPNNSCFPMGEVEAILDMMDLHQCK